MDCSLKLHQVLGTWTLVGWVGYCQCAYSAAGVAIGHAPALSSTIAMGALFRLITMRPSL